MVIYFSGTGNSRYAARKIAALCKEPLLNLTEVFRGETEAELTGEKKLVFVTPTYAWRIPRVVSDWIEKTALREGAEAWFIMTCGSGIGNAGEYNRQLCGEKKLRYMGTAAIVMPENYITMFRAPEESEARRIIERAEPFIRKAGTAAAKSEAITEKKPDLLSRAMSKWVNKVFYPSSVNDKRYRVKASCIGCGKCAKLCPLGNIRMENGKPVWQGNCTQCMACISHCPGEAIEYGRKSMGKRRYHLD